MGQVLPTDQSFAPDPNIPQQKKQADPAYERRACILTHQRTLAPNRHNLGKTDGYLVYD